MPSFTTEESKELNAWLAVNLLGWVHSHASLADCRFTLCWHHPETDYLAMYAPKSATSYEGMGAVLGELTKRGIPLELHYQPATEEWFVFRRGVRNQLGDSPHLPTAVALAAKAALLSEERYIYEVDDADAGDDANAHLIAASRNTVPAVIALAKAAEYARECLEGFSTLKPVSMTEPYPASDYDEWRILRKDAFHVALPDLQAALDALLAKIASEVK